jgi:hypothetical protein
MTRVEGISFLLPSAFVALCLRENHVMAHWYRAGGNEWAKG